MTGHFSAISALSCLPGIGSVIGSLNISQSLNSIRHGKDVLEVFLLAMNDPLSRPELFTKARQECSLKQDKILSSIKKLKVDTICTIFGSVLSVALLVGLVASGILTGTAPFILAGAFFMVRAMKAGYILHQSQSLDKDVESLVLPQALKGGSL